MTIRIRLATCAALALLVCSGTAAAPEQSVAAGIRQYEAGELGTARATLEQALAAGRERPRALAYLGLISLSEGDLDGAIDRLREAVELEPGDSMFRTGLGRAYIQKLQTVSFFEKGVLAGRALEALEKAVDLDPANVEARITLAGYYLNAPVLAGGSKRKARQQAEAIRALDPARGHQVLAGILAGDEEYGPAIEALGRCIAESEAALECRYQLAMLYQQLERWEKAFAAFEELLEIDPESRGALYQLGRTAVFSGERLERGVECFEAYLALAPLPGYPGPDAAHWRLGMLHELRGDLEEARSRYAAALALVPGEEKYRKALAGIGG